ncbi:MAG: T9SS type B sorting domain-containing protein, partial [Bacteroidia bacterium]
MIRHLLAIFLFSSVLSVNAQKLFWIGGSGNWNDGQHWSLTSGGAPSGKTPGPSNDLVVDDKSSVSDVVIDFVGTNHARSLQCLNEEHFVYFHGLSSSSLRVSGDFILNSKAYFTASTKLIFSDGSSQVHAVHPWGNVLQGDVLFEDGTWDLQFIRLSDNSTLSLLKGDYTLNKSSISGGSIIANTGAVKIHATNGILSAKNRLDLGSNVSFNAGELMILGQQNSHGLSRVNAAQSSGSNARNIAACSITYSFTNPSCNLSCDASMTVGFGVGCTTGPYTVNFNTGATCIPASTTGILPPTLVLSGLCGCQGNLVDIIVKDAGGTVAALFAQNMPANPTPIKMNNSTPIMPNCFGGCNGSVNFDISGGTGPYSFTCTPPGTSASGVFPLTTTTVNGLCVGNHTFIIQDSKACQITSVVAISQPPLLVPNGSSSSITCNGAANGSASVSPTGGTPGYTVNWSTGAFGTVSIGPLPPGVVTATVTDSKGCTQTYTTNIQQPTAITVVPTQTNVSCGGGSNGSASVSVSGGIPGPGYTYTWSPGNPPGQGTQVVTGLIAGTYTVIIRDNNLCQKTQTFNITQPPPITLTPTFTNVTCNGLCNGSAAANPTGGTPLFTYTWTAPGNIVIGNSPTVSGLCPGVYTVNVKDNLACTKSTTVLITQPPAITLTINSTSVTCNGLCNGTASVSATGGTGVFSYTWGPGSPPGFNTPAVTGLCAGNYTVQVKDSPNNCPATASVTIIQPSPILQNVTSVSVTCSGLCNGSVNSIPSGGTGPYTSTLTSSTATLVAPPPYTNLCAGIYTLTTKDASGCTISNTVNLNTPNSLTISATTTSINCFGDCNASLSGSILGGNAPYTYTWTTPTTTLSTPVIVNQCAGSYTFTVKDLNGCNTSTVVSVASPPDMTVNIVPTPPTCNGSCNGALTATVSGGTPGYAYNWSSPGSGSNVMSSLCAGTYTLNVNDTKGCIKTVTASLVAPLPISISTTMVPTNCAGSCDGQIIAQASGGTPGPGYTYQFNTTPVVTTNTTGTVAGLCSGNYVVTVTDSKGCTGSTNVLVTSPPALSAAITGVKPSCNVCIGAATVTASGGTPGYSYTWTPSAQTTSVASNLCVGDYTVFVQDSKGCSATTTVNIAQTVILVITTNGSTLACNGGCTGIATANAVGGVSPYTYTWSTSPVIQTAPSATALCAGTYSVNVADALGCSNTGTISFTNPPPIVVTSTITNALCNANCNGVISVTASGGTGGITYTWTPGVITGQGTPNATNLCAGTYTLNMEDANNCPVVQNFTVTEPPVIASTFTANSPSTCSGTNGSILSNVTGGTPTYNYTWTPSGINTPTIGSIGAGTYSLIVKDQAGCTTTLIATLSDPTGPTVTVTSNSILCNGSCSGSATVSAVGTAPLSYLWSAPLSSTNTIVSSICQGTYAVNVTDGSSCTTSQTLSISQPPPFVVNATPTNPKCSSVCDGSITTLPSGGTPAYSYTWQPGSVPGPNLNNVCAGTYTANVKDANNCSYTNTFTLVSPSTITITFTKADVKCNGVCTGTVKATPAGGTGPYTFTWTPVGSFPGSPINNIINLCANIYTVTVTDANGCSATATVQISEPPPLSNTLTVRNARCNGQCNGAATFSISGGTPVYAYSWSGSGVTTPTINSLCAGNYTATVTDANGCVMSKSLTITQPAPLTVTVSPFNPTCNGVCNGSITSSASGGTGAYTYSWIPAGSGANAVNLCSGNYTLIVTDDSLCTGQNVTSLINPAKLLSNVTFTNPSCNSNCNGVAISTPSNAVAPISYTWTNSVPAVISNVSSATALCAGMYTVIVKDNKGCRDTQQVTLVSPPSLTINPSVASAACGVCNGSITATAVGGTAPYTYTWAAPAVSATNIATNLCAGIYTVSITDANNCANVFSIPLSNSNGPNGATVSFTDVTCNGLCNGAASVTNPVGGTAPYVITWVTPASTLNPVTNLCAGTYTAQIKDNLNCLFFESVVVSQPAPLVANTTTNLPLCNGVCNGSIVAVPTGGNPNYNFSWSTGATNTGTTSSITNLCTGSYTLNITDTKGCALTQTFSMPGSSSISGSTVAVNNKCAGNCNGSILAAGIAGGLPPYTFNWSDPSGQTTPQATGLCNGPYFVIIKDFNGCFDTLKSNVISPAAITLTSSVVQPTCGLCNGTSTVGALGGTAPYTYSWSSGPTGPSATNLCAGLYMVSITDSQGCAQNVSVTINNSSTLSNTISSTNETCFGLCNGTASVTASGGTAPLTYNWVSPAATTNTLSGLCGGTYFVQVKDAVGCIRTSSVTINSATSLTVTPFVMQPGCGSTNGTITVGVTGGTGPITYNWMPGGGTTATLTNIGAGTYTLTVTQGGCSKTNVFNITNQNAQTISLTAINASCNGTCNAMATVSVTSGTGPYTFNWSMGTAASSPSMSTASNLCSGVVIVTVTSTGNGCVVTQSISTTQPPPIVGSLPIITLPKCHNDCNGAIAVVASGGTLPYAYSWSPAGSTNPLTNLCAGPGASTTYSATITDAKGCTSVTGYTLINPPIFALAANVMNASCNTIADGAITTTVTGGIPAYSYTWTGPAAFSSTAASLPAILPGTYSLSLTDFAGCRKDTSMLVISTITVIANAGNDTTFCQSGSFNLNGSASTGATAYQWFQLPNAAPISNTVTVVVSPPIGTSTFVLIASNGVCASRDTMKLTSNPVPMVDAGPDYTISIYSSVSIGGSPTAPSGSTFSWTPSSTLDNPAVSNPVASNTVNTTYTVSIVDMNGCTGSDTMHVLIYPQIIIPNGFSPNADGKNDTWMLDNIQQFPNCTVEIYNRWGEPLFYSKGYGTNFDGKYKGQDLPVGTY